MTKNNITYEEAVLFVKKGRNIIDPNIHFSGSLKKYSEWLQNGNDPQDFFKKSLKEL